MLWSALNAKDIKLFLDEVTLTHISIEEHTQSTINVNGTNTSQNRRQILKKLRSALLYFLQNLLMTRHNECAKNISVLCTLSFLNMYMCIHKPMLKLVSIRATEHKTLSKQLNPWKCSSLKNLKMFLFNQGT